jgi:FkbM family methyltransferase
MRLTPRLKNFGSTSIYIKRDHYEPELLAIRHFISEGDVVLDIGASFGIYSLFMSTYVGSTGTVYAFEPGAFSYSQLTFNIALNRRSKRINSHNVAASDRAHVAHLYHIANSPVNFSLGRAEGIKYEDVRADRVDAVVRSEDQSRVRFIKIDVEGYERTALEGARKIIDEARPVIMFEVSTSALQRRNLKPESIYEFISSFGYEFYMFNRQQQFERVLNTPDGNIFAIPADQHP